MIIMNKTKKERSSNDTKLSRFFKSPIKYLIKARDMYMRGITECSDRLSHCTIIGTVPSCHISTSSGSSFPSRDRSNEDFRELMRAASVRAGGRRGEPCVGIDRYNRSRSSTIMRIDEDSPCEFGGDENDVFKAKSEFFARSKSYSHGVRRNIHN